MAGTNMKPLRSLQDAIHDALQQSRPVLTHLNADTSWVLSLPYPVGASHPAGRRLFHILIDPWLQGPQSDLASWFSQQWHVIASSVQTISELNACLENLEASVQIQCSRSLGQTNDASRTHSHADVLSCIDMVVVSHEFTDHCNRATLQEIPRNTPVFATQAAASLILSWHYFHQVHCIPSFSNWKHDWKKTLPIPLPSWLGIARITTKKDALYFHSAILITFDIRSSSTDESIEGIIYTPHGIPADGLEMLSSAEPGISVLALLHGLHDIKITVKQLNLGAHNALRAQRVCGAKYWISTHDEVKKAGGLINHFLKRKKWTIEDALKEEERKKEKTGIDGPLADIRDVHFANLASGQSLLLH
ncbi:MAG: hypothetical protein Q9225_005581 [Loekoesia sp. 1 TL-2023]